MQFQARFDALLSEHSDVYGPSPAYWAFGVVKQKAAPSSRRSIAQLNSSDDYRRQTRSARSARDRDGTLFVFRRSSVVGQRVEQDVDPAALVLLRDQAQRLPGALVASR
jgi:hypothetical protein